MLADDLLDAKSTDADKVRAERDDLKARLDAAHDIIERQKRQLASKAKPRYRLPSARPRSDNVYIRAVLPDTHGTYIHKAAFAAFLGDLGELKPRELIMLGDHVDCGGFLAEHHVLNYVASADYSYNDDLAAANGHLDEIQNRLPPDCVIDYLEGNHERRIERWVMSQKLRNKKDAEMLREAVHPESQLHLDTRGIAYHRMDRFHDGLTFRGAIKRGPCYFLHGFSHAKKATEVTLQKIGAPVVHGHTHREDVAAKNPANIGEIKGWCPGGMCESSPLYAHGTPTDWTTGYAIQLVRESDSTFLHITIPIIGGRSFLLPLIERFR